MGYKHDHWPHLHDTTTIDTRQPLRDNTTRGKERPWADHRSEAELLAYAYDDINPDKAARIRCCAPRLSFAVDGESGRLKLDAAWFCRVRLCPVCQWRRSLKCYAQAAQIVAEIERREPGRWAWLMVTLTVRNADPYELAQTLQHMADSWHRLIKLEPWTRVVHGTMRSLEITHNLDLDGSSYDTYHPHYHVLVMVPATYFRSRHYLSRDRWAQLWRAAARLDYSPQVWVSRIKALPGKPEAIAAAIAEVAKYATKPSDYIIPDDLDMMTQTVELLDTVMHRRRLVAYTGKLKEVKRDLGLIDVDDDQDLVHTSADDDAAAAAGVIVNYRWVNGLRNYYKEVQLGKDN